MWKLLCSTTILGFVLLACGGGEKSDAPAQPSAPNPSGASRSMGKGRASAVTCPTAAGECRSDSDCSAGAVCGCNIGNTDQNVCLTQSNCRVDADCGSEKCNLSLPYIYANGPGSDAGAGLGGVTSGKEVGGFYGTDALGYFCTSPADECVPGEPTNAIGDCVFGIANGHWVVGSKP